MGGRTVIGIPQVTARDWIFLANQKMEPPNSAVPNVAETGRPPWVLHAVRTGVSAVTVLDSAAFQRLPSDGCSPDGCGGREESRP